MFRSVLFCRAHTAPRANQAEMRGSIFSVQFAQFTVVVVGVVGFIFFGDAHGIEKAAPCQPNRSDYMALQMMAASNDAAPAIRRDRSWLHFYKIHSNTHRLSP